MHYTTQTNQVKETNSVVDRGFHYVATDSEGIPSDADSDGISDYWEDINGDGLHQTSETSWTNPDSDADGVNDADEVALGRNPVIFGTTQDAGILNLRVYTPLK